MTICSSDINMVGSVLIGQRLSPVGGAFPYYDVIVVRKLEQPVLRQCFGFMGIIKKRSRCFFYDYRVVVYIHCGHALMLNHHVKV